MRGFDPYGRSTLWGIRGACPPAAIFSMPVVLITGSNHPGAARHPPTNHPGTLPWWERGWG